tara:strand:+ start:287 stop:592 length:306 start_codon:yes stop_codon:yes gene_type:complete
MYNILLQAESSEPGFPWVLLLGMFIIMYFFMIRPQQKRQKEAKEFRDAISKGDKVVTIGGVHGKILSISDMTVVLEVESGKIRVSKSALSPSGSPEVEDVK